MNGWRKGTLTPWLVPGGVLLIAAVILLGSGMFSLSTQLVSSYYYVVFTAGILLAWRFHSSRILCALLVLLLAHHALEFFSTGHTVATGAGRIALEAISVLVPLNFVFLSLARERGVTIPALASGLGVLFVESVFVAVICRPGEITAPAFLHPAFFDRHWFQWTRIPQLAWLVFAGALIVLCVRFLLYHKPIESGLLWSLAGTLFSLQSGGIGRIASAYWATGGLILASSIIENSYLLAYHDELTGLPGRRAFNDALLGLAEQYVIAAVDIDHFKSFNDTYGHETGDQVLRMVAAKLVRVGGHGRAFRVGGEEFSILFSGESMDVALPHLERLRVEVATSAFRARGSEERRRNPRPEPDRRRASRGKSVRSRRAAGQSSTGELSVTISVGVAVATATTRSVQSVIRAADRALYRAKQSGRNRVEVAGSAQARPKRHIA